VRHSGPNRSPTSCLHFLAYHCPPRNWDLSIWLPPDLGNALASTYGIVHNVLVHLSPVRGERIGNRLGEYSSQCDPYPSRPNTHERNSRRVDSPPMTSAVRLRPAPFATPPTHLISSFNHFGLQRPQYYGNSLHDPWSDGYVFPRN
jgi:hypothetical protein